MKTWKRYVLGLLVGVSSSRAAWAQLPGAAPAVPAAPAAPAAAVPGAGAVPGAPGAVPGVPGAAPAAPAAPNNIWSMLCMSPDQRAACRAKFCASPFGQMASASGQPLALMTGGLLGNCCPKGQPTPQDLAQPADSSAGAAARIKQDEADAKARRAAVRYLGTVDCRYWPEAEEALVNALRGDRNECVRWEAGLALQKGCCCTPKIIEALSITVSGSERDGQPAERSERVKEAAAIALSQCVVDVPTSGEAPATPAAPPPVEERKELLPPPEKRSASTRDYYRRIAAQPRSAVIENARKSLAQYSARSTGPVALAAPLEVRPGSNGLFGVLAHAVSGRTAPTPGTTITTQEVLAPGTTLVSTSLPVVTQVNTPPTIVTPAKSQPLPVGTPVYVAPPVVTPVKAQPMPAVTPAYVPPPVVTPVRSQPVSVAPVIPPTTTTPVPTSRTTTAPVEEKRGLLPMLAGVLRGNSSSTATTVRPVPDTRGTSLPSATTPSVPTSYRSLGAPRMSTSSGFLEEESSSR